MVEKRKRSPLADAELENFGFFEGRVVVVAPKENTKGVPQIYTTVEQRILRQDGTRVGYNIAHFVAWGDLAKAYLERVRPGYHIRIKFRVTHWMAPGRQARLSLAIERFRAYRFSDDDLDAWMEDGFFGAPMGGHDIDLWGEEGAA